MKKQIEVIESMKKGKYEESADGHTLVSSNGTILTEQPHHTSESISQKNTTPLRQVNSP